MTPQDLQAMTTQAISAHLTKRHGVELRRLSAVITGMKDQDYNERFSAVAMFLAGSTSCAGKEAQAIRGELNRRLRSGDI